MEYKIAIIGSDDAVSGFRAVGVDALGVKTKEECEQKIREAHAANTYAIIFITEDWVEQIKDTIDELGTSALPAIVAVPSQKGSTGAGLKNLSKIVEQAVGSDILQMK